ncbi:MAG: hypothetical protein U0802_01370 [Candidatus Binatia bacterium]
MDGRHAWRHRRVLALASFSSLFKLGGILVFYPCSTSSRGVHRVLTDPAATRPSTGCSRRWPRPAARWQAGGGLAGGAGDRPAPSTRSTAASPRR